MSEKKINLLKIFNNYFDCYTEFDSRWSEIDEQKAITESSFNEAMLEFGKQLLELAAENAKTREMIECWSGQVWDDGPLPIGIDKQSITNTIKQVI